MDEHKFLSMCRAICIIMIGIIPLVCAHARTPYGYFTTFCGIGERAPGSPGHTKARDFIIDNLTIAEVDSFFAYGTWLYNIYRRFPGEDMRIGIAAHWDSDIGCPGANDGGSGVSLLLSLADTLEKNPSKIAVDLLFFDGEDINKAELLGSQHYASKNIHNYSFILVVDMVGDRNLQIFKEGNSSEFFPTLVDSIWKIAMEYAPAVFMPAVKYFIVDDHISLIKYGIRAIDIIDFDYPYWHSRDDTVDKCSKESLDTIYGFLLQIVYPTYVY